MARRRYQKGYLKEIRKGEWQARWREDVITAGGRKRKQRSKVVFAPTKRLAQRELDRELERINSVEYTPKHETRWEDFVAQWVNSVLSMHELSSQVTEKAHINKHILPAFKGMMVAEIEPVDVQMFISSIKLKPKSVSNIYRTLVLLWKSAKAWGYTTRKLDGITLPRLGPVNRRVFSAEEIKRIVESADEPYKTLYWLAAETGMRVRELCGLRGQDIDFSNHVVSIRQTLWNGQARGAKTENSYRSLAISPQLAASLMRVMRGDGLLFPGMTTKGIYRRLHPLLERLGIPRGGMHAFRHANASILIANGMDARTVAGRLGHADPSITLRVYSHFQPRKDREAVEIVGRELFPSCSLPTVQGNA